MTELQAIKERHSVRSYQEKKIEAEKIEQLNAMIETCNKEGNLNLQLLPEAGGTFQKKLMSRVMGLASAPSVIACVAADDPTAHERIGYYGEKIVLYAQTLGLNTCWAGTFSAKNVPANRTEGDILPIVIALGYGNTQGKSRKSKSVEQVAEGKSLPDWFVKGVKAALLAPTAINQQKFKIRLADDGKVSFEDLGGVLSKIDLGIIRYHFEVGSKA